MWRASQPACDLAEAQKTKSSRPQTPLVVVVYRGFSATTTIEKTNQPTFEQLLNKKDNMHVGSNYGCLTGYKMPRFKQIPQIQALMGSKEHIRNIGIIAHIDHGKTTLADSLLAGAGLLSPQMAGIARVLDYLDEEQKRKITIKTANITLLYKKAAQTYLIYLIDTPGHVDFTGKVTRALRVIDGAVVVVDAVEEIMAQTEILTRQALEERVRPVLFINKVDRLITELQLSEEQIQAKLNQIISRFNDLIELYTENPYRNLWKINPSAGNVAFGSALYGWGFTYGMAKQHEIKFAEVIKAVKAGEQAKLKKSLPVYEAIFEMAVDVVPSPREAQAYRMTKIWDGQVGSKVGKSLAKCSDDGPAVMYITNIHAVPNGDTTVSGRVFSGRVKNGDKLHLVDALTNTEVKQVAIDMGSFHEDVHEVSAGNLASLTLTGRVQAGETLVDLADKEGMVPFEGISYVSEPVVTLAVEPKNPKDIEALQQGLERLASEDPNLKAATDKETGEYLLSGMGELHLEVALNQLKSESAIDVAVSSPRVVYMECAQKKGDVALAKSPNKHSSFWVQVEPEQDAQSTDDDKGIVLSLDEHRNILFDCNSKTDDVCKEVLEAIIAGFEYACRAGPLCGEPIRHLKVNLLDFELDEGAETNSEVMRGVGKAVFASFLTADPTLQEPIYKIIITVASELASESSRIISTRRGKVTSFEQKGLLSQISGYIPVAETFGFSKELRSATSGRAVWQSFFDHWEKVPPKLAAEVIVELRKRKGLAPEVPKPEKFMEQ
ncbi:MAG: GTP-binding protein [Candidatus Bathyarchaeota archaeon]|nr:GTP-binding protein [Candidatus Bathyarchaeota archaeon]